MARTVTIENKRKRMHVYNLDHPTLRTAGRKYGYRRVEMLQVDTNARTGERAFKRVRKSVPSSLTLTAKGTPGSKVEGLPVAVLRAPQIVADRKAGLIKVSYVDTPEEKPPKKTKRRTEVAETKAE